MRGSTVWSGRMRASTVGSALGAIHSGTRFPETPCGRSAAIAHGARAPGVGLVAALGPFGVPEEAPPGPEDLHALPVGHGGAVHKGAAVAQIEGRATFNPEASVSAYRRVARGRYGKT